MTKQKSNSVDWLEGFGHSKNHDIFFIKSNASPIRMACDLEKLFHRNVHFLKDAFLMPKYPHLPDSIFFSVLNFSQEAYLILVPNRIIISAQDLDKSSDPLLGGFLFDDECFLFNNLGDTLYKTSFNNYDYMLLLSCDKNYRALDDVLDTLKSVPSFKTVLQSDLLQPASRKAVEKSRVEYLQHLFVDVEINIGTFLEEYLCKVMQGNTTIPRENYTVHRFDDGKTSLLPILGSPLMRRENI